MINVAEVIQDPDFAQEFNIIRTSGDWVNGRFVPVYVQLTLMGIITPLNTKDVSQLPQGDTIEGALNVYTLQEIFITSLAKNPNAKNYLSDQIVWHNENYKVDYTRHFSDFGYYHALAVRKRGA